MPDTMTKEQRHYCMSRIRGKDTRPEMVVRRGLHSMGFRYSLHSRRLPGCPDLVLRRYHTVIFVNGCFWHGHRGCRHATRPKSNADELSAQALDAMGWKVVTVWECGLKKDRREGTLHALAGQIRCNGAAYNSEQAQRRERNAEHRARIKAAKERYESMMAELGLAESKNSKSQKM